MEILGNILQDTWLIILAVLGLSFIIFVHELGHFIMAKRAGVKVDKFYIGFDVYGFKVFSITRHDTEYGIGILPFGGYVKLHGYEELPGHEKEIKDLTPAHFHSKTVGERFGIMVGGVAMNFISAIFLILIMYGIGKEFEAPIISGNLSPAAMEGGLKEDDKIISIAGKPIKTFMDISKKIVLSNPNEPLAIKVERNKEVIDLIVTPEMNHEHGVPFLGVTPQNSLTIRSIVQGSPASKAGFLPNDIITSVNGEKIEKYYQFNNIIEKNSSQALTVGIVREGKPLEIKLTPSTQPSYLMQFESGLKNKDPIEIKIVSPHSAAAKAGIHSWDKIAKINDKNVHRIEDISNILAESNGNEVQIELIRNAETLKVPLTPLYNKVERRFMLGVATSQDSSLCEIGEIEVNGPAYLAGLRTNDKIISINNEIIKSVSHLAHYVANQKLDNAVNITYERLENNEWKSFQSKITLRSLGRMGIFTRLYHKTQTLISKNIFIYDANGLGVKFKKNFHMAEPTADSNAALAGFQKNDKFLGVSFLVPGDSKVKSYSNDKLPSGWNSIDRIFSHIASHMSIKKGELTDILIPTDKLIVNIKFERDGKEMEISVSPAEMPSNKKGFSGIDFNYEMVLYRYSSVGEAVSLVYTESMGMLEFTVSSFSKLVSGDFSVDALSGPVGMFPMLRQVAEGGLLKVLYIVAFLSINIGFMNFLPFPPLDGGAIFFLLIEKLKGSPVSAKFQIAVTNFGILFLIGLMLFVTMNDIDKIVG